MNTELLDWKLLNRWLLLNVSERTPFNEYEINFVDELGEFQIENYTVFDEEQIFSVEFTKLHDCLVYMRVLTHENVSGPFCKTIQVLNTQEGKMSWESVIEDSGPFWYTVMNLPMPKYD